MKSNKKVKQMMIDSGFYEKWYHINTIKNTDIVSIKANETK